MSWFFLIAQFQHFNIKFSIPVVKVSFVQLNEGWNNKSTFQLLGKWNNHYVFLLLEKWLLYFFAPEFFTAQPYTIYFFILFEQMFF